MALFLINVLSAQTEFSGFFDIYNSAQFEIEEYSGFQINQFELDISHSYKESLSLGTAIAFNPNMGQFELASAYLHYSIFNKAIMHPRRKEERNHTAIMIGKFDVPFGLDYLSLASPDRPTFYQPLPVEKSIGAWNDMGINIHVLADQLKGDFTIVNGFNEGVNLSAKIEYEIFQKLNMGISHASDFSSFKQRNNWANGISFLADIDIVQIKSEYIWARGLLHGEQDTLNANGTNHGFYIQALTELEPIIGLPYFVTARYGIWNSSKYYKEEKPGDRQDRFTFTIGYHICSECSVRSDIQSDQFGKNERSTQATIQLVVGF